MIDYYSLSYDGLDSSAKLGPNTYLYDASSASNLQQIPHNMSHRTNSSPRCLPRIITSSSTRNSSRRAPPPPPPTRSSWRPRRIPVTQLATFEESENPFSDIYSSSSPLSSDSEDEFDPTSSNRHSPQSMTPRTWQLHNACTEDRSKLVAGKILSRGLKAMQYSKRPSHYVRSGLSNVVVVAGDDS